MAKKKIKEKLAAVSVPVNYVWTFETQGPDNNFRGLVKNEKGKIILEILQNDEYNHLVRMKKTSKYMSDRHDVKGLAQYLVDRSLVPFTDEEKEKWKGEEHRLIVLKEIQI